MNCKNCGNEIVESDSGFCRQCSVSLTVPVDASPHFIPQPRSPSPAETPSHTRYQAGAVIAKRYRIIRLLGEGGMGSVYQADDLTLNVPVALKFVSASMRQDPEALELLLNEARLARRITHPNVCRIYDVAEVDGQHFLSMEYVQGEDLASLLRRISRLPGDKAIDLGIEICQGLAAAHEGGILHRDLKPGNLMIDAQGHAKVMDFGLAALGGSRDAQRQTIGTPIYMAPEQRAGKISIHSDIYMLGMVLYELLTGRKAYYDLVEEDESGEFWRNPAQVADELDPAAEQILRQCLDRDPLMRPPTARAVAAVLAELRQPAWRPDVGMFIPDRDNWALERKLGVGGFGETWLAVHRKTRDRRVFKFCNDSVKLRALQREITLFRYVREVLGNREDIARILDWRIEKPPYFIEMEYTSGGNLLEWAAERGGIGQVPLEERLEIVAQTAVALSAAHSVGLLHKDIKPANLLVHQLEDGTQHVRLCDFGLGALKERERLRAAGITAMGLSMSDEEDSSRYAGTRLYMAPELLEGRPATTGADIYALGILLYQAVIGDFSRALAPGWERDVPDEILCEDIAGTVDRIPERRCSALQLAEGLRMLPQRQALRAADLKAREQAEQASENLKRNRRRSRWATAALGFLLLLVLALWFAFDRAEGTTRQAVIAQAMRRNEAMAQLAAAAVADKLEAVVQRVQQESADPLLGNLMAAYAASSQPDQRAQLQGRLQRHLDMLLRRSGKHESWVLADASADLIARAPYDRSVIGKNYRYREWFNGIKELPATTPDAVAPRSKIGISSAYKSASQGNPMLMNIAAPVWSPSTPENTAPARIIGVIGATLRMATFNEWLAVAESRPAANGCPDSFVLLVYRDQLLRHPCPSPDMPPLPVRKGDFWEKPALQELMASPSGSSLEFRDPMRHTPNGLPIESLAVVKSPETLSQWKIILVQDVEAALRPMAALFKDFRRPAEIALGVGGLALIALIALLWWGDRIIK